MASRQRDAAICTERHLTFDKRDELVAASCDCGHEVRMGIDAGQGSAQVSDIDLQVVLVNHQAGPDASEYFVTADNFSSALDQQGQDVKGAPSEGHRRPAKGQGLGGRIQHEILEAIQRLCVSTEI